ncbi:MAG: DUF2304 domain-containing protein [Bacteroidota bacterium]
MISLLPHLLQTDLVIKPIQYLLIPVLGLLLVLFFVRLKRHPLIRILVSLILIAALVFTIDLDSSTRLAQWLGIGRGVDLVIYLSLLGLTVSCILLYLRTVKLEALLTELARNQAIEEGKAPKAEQEEL